jgi:hypothetical protein
MILYGAGRRTSGLFASALLAASVLAGCGRGSHGVAPPVPRQNAAAAPAAPAGSKIHVMRSERTTPKTSQHGRRVSTYSGSGPLTYHGGPVMHEAHLYLTYWGWSGDPNGEGPYLESFLHGLPGSAWLGTVTQYSDSGGASTNLSYQYGGVWHDNTNPLPANPSDAQIQAEASAASSHFGGDPDGIYFVATPQNHATPGFASGTNGGFCSYHGYTGSILYVNFPYQTDSQACTSESQAHPGSASLLDVVSVVAGHEIAETINDPNLNAWIDGSGNEIGDKCAWINLRIASLPTGNFAMQPLFDDSVTDCVQPDVGGMMSLSNPGVQLFTNPAVARNPDGRLEAVASDVNGTLWHIWQTSAGGGWTGWYSLGGYGFVPCMIANADGRLQAAMVNWDGTLTEYWQTSVNGGWTSANIGSGGGGFQYGCAMAANSNGTLEVVAVGSDGNLYHATQTSAGGSGWTGFSSLGSPGAILDGGPAIARNQNGTLDVVVTATDGAVYHDAQTSPGGGWTGFASLGTVPSGVSGRIVLTKNADGRLEAFIGSIGNGIYHVWQSSPNSASWSGLWNVAPPPAGLSNAVAAAVNSPGELEVFATNGVGAIWTSWQTSPGGSWSAWESLGADQSNWPFAAVGTNSDGRLELFTIQNDGSMYHTWENAAGAGWIW